MFTRLVVNIVRKDWSEFRDTLFVLAAAMLFPSMLADRSPDLARGAVAGLGISACYAISYFCFSGERRRRTLCLLLSLPVRPAALILAKYASLYSMVLFATCVPILFTRDLRLALLAGSFVVFVSTLSMSFSVVSDRPWAPVLPMWFVVIAFLPVHRLVERYFPEGLAALRFLGDHRASLAGAALAVTPLIAIGSAIWFERKEG